MSANLVIVDDHRVFCQGLEAVFAAEPDFEPMAISHSDQVLPAVTACTPDAVLMDVRIGRANGIDLTRRLTAMSSPPGWPRSPWRYPRRRSVPRPRAGTATRSAVW